MGSARLCLSCPEVESRLSLGVSSQVPDASPKGSLRPAASSGGWRVAKNASLCLTQHPGLLGEGQATDSPQLLAPGVGRLLPSDPALEPEPEPVQFWHQNRNSGSLENSLFLYFCKCQFDDQLKHGAISMVFIRRTVCGLTMTGRERELSHCRTTTSDLVNQPPERPRPLAPTLSMRDSASNQPGGQESPRRSPQPFPHRAQRPRDCRGVHGPIWLTLRLPDPRPGKAKAVFSGVLEGLPTTGRPGSSSRCD